MKRGIATRDTTMSRRIYTPLLLAAAALSKTAVDGFSYAPWAPTTVPVAPTLTAPATIEVTKNRNPRYPDLPFDKYLANPYFQKINTEYPGLQLINENPFVFIVNDFLATDECDRLVDKAMAGTDETTLRPQFGGGSVVRTSHGAVCENEEVPTIRKKMSHLTNVSDLRQLQYLKISRYMEGQEFSKHTDAWPTESAPVCRGWVNEDDFFGDRKRPVQGCMSSHNKPFHNNFMTCLVYLNNIPTGRGGCTTFPNIGLHTGRDGTSFYDEPAPMDSRTRQDGSEWDWDFGRS